MKTRDFLNYEEKIGAAGFEPATPRSQSECSSR